MDKRSTSTKNAVSCGPAKPNPCGSTKGTITNSQHPSNIKTRTHVFTTSLPTESATLSEIAIRAKGYWGYSQEKLDSWREGLRIKPDFIEKNIVRSLRLQNQTIGFFAIVEGQPNKLDHLWILPEFIGKGYGALALQEIHRICRERSVRELTIISDPDAEGFYLHHGAIRIGECHSIPQNRMLPKLTITID